MTKEEILSYCISRYNEIYQKTKSELETEAINKNKKHIISENKAKEIENASQLEAIKITLLEGRLLFPEDISLLWAKINNAHLFRKTGINDLAVTVHLKSSNFGHLFSPIKGGFIFI